MRSDTESKHNESYEFVSAIKANDEKVLKQFYQLNYPKVERFVLENNGTTDEAKDIYQEAFIAVWRNIQLDRFQLRQETSPHAYLFQVAKYKWLDHLRSSKRRQMVPLPEGLDIEALPEEAQQQIINIKNSLSRLGEVCRDILERFYFLRQSMKNIAEARQWTEATAKNNKYRCLQQLRDFLKTNIPKH